MQFNFSFIFIFLFFGLLINTFYNFWYFNRVFFGSIKVFFEGKYTKIQKYQDITKREFFVFIILIFWLIFLGFCPEKLINFTQVHLIYLNIRSLS
jgi:NADH:ubiquinone oxidoreductase subunit 4 (subunit M)